MSDPKLNCRNCNASILTSTFENCSGLCMPCFKRENGGLRPVELASVKARGLYGYFQRWNAFVLEGVPKIKSHRRIVDELNHFLPLISASVSGYLRFGQGAYDGTDCEKFLNRLKSQCDGELLEFLAELDRFNNELVNATKT